MYAVWTRSLKSLSMLVVWCHSRWGREDFSIDLHSPWKKPKILISPQWSTPYGFIRDHIENGLFLLPPQVYELSRMCNFPSYQTVQNFTKKREQYGIQRWVPSFFIFKDGICTLLPGDDLYPSQSENIGDDYPHDHSLSLRESRSRAINLNRLEFSESVYTCFCNQELISGHLAPISNIYTANTFKPML